ncbi:MAG: SGNH/GDSL hydrolase family protein [Phycisphaerae bacterium]|nr:SGNH/GDSL hydrolase family protein [Phycisphaerae bacterium]
MSENVLKSRRQFLKTTAALAIGAAGLSITGCENARTASKPAKGPFIKKNATVLFQGDSITDAGRDRKRGDIANDPGALGRGYAFNIASQLLAERPNDNLKFFNRGNSGWKVPQLASSWDRNCIAIKPDVLSIMIGVNDYWHTVAFGRKFKGTVGTYERDYRALLNRTVKELPGIKLVVCEPYALRCGKHINDSWFPTFDHYRAVSKKLADEFGALFVPFQSILEKAATKDKPLEYWAGDGIHPSKPGAELMAQEWLKVVEMG